MNVIGGTIVMQNEISKSVDIIIPVYNAFEDLEICLKSVKRHTNLKKHRVILINDNSSDERIRMEQSEDHDVILLNSDTVVTKDWVEKILICAYSENEIGTVTPVSNNATLCSVPNFCEENSLPEYLNIDKAAEIVEKCSFCDYPQITVAHGFCMFVKREVIRKIGKFDAETFGRGYGEENDFCNRAEQAGYMHVMCDNTYIYHSGTKSFMSKEKEKYIQEHDQILQERYPVQMHNNAVHCRDNPNKYIGDNIRTFFAVKNGKKNVLYVLHSDFSVGKNDNIGGTQFHVRDLKDGLKDDYNIFVVARNLDMLCLTAYIGDRHYSFDFYIGKPDEFIRDSNRVLRKVFDNILEAFEIDLIHVHHTIGLSFDIFYLAQEKSIPIILTAHDFYYLCPTIKLLSKTGKTCCNKISSESCRKCLRDVCGIIEDYDYMKEWRKRICKIFDICKKIILPSKSAEKLYFEAFPEYKDKYQVLEHGVRKQREEKFEVSNKKRGQFRFGIDGMKKNGINYCVMGWVNAFEIDRRNERFYLQLKVDENELIYVPITLHSIDYQRGIVARFEAVLPVFQCRIKELMANVVICDDENVVYFGETEAVHLKVETDDKIYKFRVAFIGGLDVAKGSKVVYDIINQGAHDVQWFTFGTVGDEKLQNLSKENYTAIGKYHAKDLPKLIEMHHIDIIGILSIWPETYSYTMSEAIMCEKPVIVTDIGALGERMKKYGCGYTVSVEHAAQEFIQYVDDVKGNKSLYNQLHKRTKEVILTRMDEMLERYQILYEEIVKDDGKLNFKGVYDQRFIYQASKQTIQAGNYVAVDMENLGREKIDFWMKEAEEYRILKSTLTYQFIMKIINMRFPFKRQIMDWLYSQLKDRKSNNRGRL